MHRIRSVSLVVVVTGMLAAPAAFAQDGMQDVLKRLDALEKKVQELERQNQSLTSELATARANAAPAAPAPEAAPSPATVAVATPPATQQPGDHDHVPAAVHEGETFPNLKLRGFADVDFSATDAKGVPSGFNLGQFVLHISSALSPRTSVFGELSFTARSNQYTTEVERLIVRYDANDYFKLSFGKYHTPVNYWNTAFHHGAWLQTTISRPEMIQFGGRFLPVHFVGGLVEGAIPSGGLGLNYSVGVGNGRQTVSLLSRDGDAGDVNGNRAVVFNLSAKPARLYGLQLGGSFYKDKVTPDGVSPNSFREWIGSGYVVWSKETPELISEVANVHHSNVLTGQDWNSIGTYTQLAYRLPFDQKKWKPYYRFEYIHAPATEPVLQVPNLLGHTAGMRYDITDFAAFKIEYRSAERSPTLRTNGVFLQTAFTF